MKILKDTRSYIIIGLYLVALVFGLLFLYRYSLANNSKQSKNTTNQNSNINAFRVATVVPEDVKESIIKNPPVLSSKTSKITQTAIKNTDGVSATLFTDGQSNSDDIKKAESLKVSIHSPLDVIYDDQTGQYPLLGQTLKEYINADLFWGSEIGSLKEIIVKNVDPSQTGWCGLYSGSYTQSSSIQVSSVITINVNDACYHSNKALFNDYMELILSHEYGHHYTLYRKWVGWQLLGNTRFPDAYYSVRQLDKTKTATDYSLGWANCDSEIIAEDYSYFYSGFGYDGVSSTWGYPSAQVKSWFESGLNGSTSLAASSAISASDAPLSVTLAAPTANQVLSGTVTAAANISGHPTKVSFYWNDSLIAELSNAPYSVSIDTTKIPDGSYTLKVVATNENDTKESTISVSVKNITGPDVEAPIVNFVQPKLVSFDWTGSDPLTIEIKSSDNVKVVKMELYINGSLVFPAAKDTSSHNYDDMAFTWSADTVAPGQYELKAIVYDAAGNKGESTIKITRTIIETNQNSTNFENNDQQPNDNLNQNTNT